MMVDLSQDEALVLNEFRKSKAMNSARFYMIVEQGRITTLDVTERKRDSDLSNLYNKHTFREPSKNNT